MSAPFGYDGGAGGQQGNEGGHPAWNEYLNELPQELHEQVTPVFEKWDKGVQERFQKVHSQYEPWKGIIGSGVEPSMVQFGINLLSSLETNPKAVYDSLGQYYGYGQGTSEQGQENPQDQENKEEPWKAEIETLRKQNEILATHALQRQEAERQAAADKALDAELSGLRQKHGDFDEFWVLSRMQAGASAEDAVKQYHDWFNKQVEGYRPKPLIMGAGNGTLPGQSTDVTKMTDAQRRAYGLQMLQAMNAQRQQ